MQLGRGKCSGITDIQKDNQRQNTGTQNPCHVIRTVLGKPNEFFGGRFTGFSLQLMKGSITYAG